MSPRVVGRGRPGTPLVGGAVDVVAGVSGAAMPDRCEITRTAEGGAMAGKNWQPGAATVVYRGACRVQVAQALPVRSRQVLFGDEPITERMYMVAVPLEARNVEVGDNVAILTSADGALVARELRVMNVGRGTFASDRYLLCDDPQEA